MESKQREKESRSVRDVQLEHKRYAHHLYTLIRPLTSQHKSRQFCKNIHHISAQMKLRHQMEKQKTRKNGRLIVCFVHPFGIKPGQTEAVGEC